MNIKKMVSAGLLLFAVQFSLVNVLSGLVGPFLGGTAWVTYAWQIFLLLVLVGIVYKVAMWYFAGNSKNYIQGIYLGLALVITGFLISILQLIPALILGREVLAPLTSYITSMAFLVTSAVTLAAATLTGFMAGRGK